MNLSTHEDINQVAFSTKLLRGNGALASHLMDVITGSNDTEATEYTGLFYKNTQFLLRSYTLGMGAFQRNNLGLLREWLLGRLIVRLWYRQIWLALWY